MPATATTTSPARLWPVAAPVLGALALGLTWGRDPALPTVLVVAVVLTAAILAAVHHAEVIAHRVGEPFGSLVLAVAVTVIEVALIVTLMVSGGDKAATLARDTVFAAAMITMNGIVGLSLLTGALRHGVPRFNAEGAGVRCSGVAAAVDGLRGHPDRTAPGLLPARGRGGGPCRTGRRARRAAGGPDMMQTSLNLAYGSAMASIGLTVPAIAVASVWLAGPLILGLGPVQIVLLLLTALVSVLTLVPGRATRLEGAVHLTLFAAFVFLSVNP